jgi:integrase
MKMKFTDTFLRNLKPEGDKDRDIMEGQGFGIRVRAGGSKVFFYKYRFREKLRFLKLGIYPHISLADARQKYGDAYKLRKNGFDPMEVEAEATRARAKEIEAREKDEEARDKKVLTVADLIDLFIKKYAKPHKKSWHKDELTLAKDVRPAWGDRPATEITKLDATTLLQTIVDRGRPGQAQNALESTRRMYNWAIDQGMLEITPFRGVKRPAPKNKKDRALTEKEIKIFWDELNAADMSDEIRRALKLTLVTGQRPGEVIGMHTNEITDKWWTIPKEKTKNKKAHRVYLTGLALELVGPLKSIDPKTGETKPKEYIFSCPHKEKKKPIQEGAMGHAIRFNYEAKKFSIYRFTPHDLRRTAVTHLARLKVPLEWRERIVNHLPKELDAIYNLYEYDEEKETSMKRWEQELMRIFKQVDKPDPEN